MSRDRWRLASRAYADDVKGPLLEQLDAVLATGEQTVTIDRDRAILRQRWQQARDRLSRSGFRENHRDGQVRYRFVAAVLVVLAAVCAFPFLTVGIWDLFG